MIVLTNEVDRCSGKRVPSYPFSSLMFELPKLATKRIIQWGENNISDSDIYEDPSNPLYGREYESHVTVIYGIHDDKPKEIRNFIRKQKPFHIEFGKVSVFDCPKFDVVKIEIESIELRRINKFVQDHFEVTNDNRTFRPHVTIAFLKKDKKMSFCKDDFAGNRIIVDRLTFSNCNGEKTIIEFDEK